ncbi:MAG: STAS domain-containing protein [Nitrospirales bacterium]
MIIKEKLINGMHVLCLTGKLDIFSRNSFRDTVETHKKNGTKGLILDLQGVSFIDSVGIGALVLAAKTFQGVKGKVILVNPQDIVKTALHTMNLSAILPIFETDTEYSTFTQPT